MRVHPIYSNFAAGELSPRSYGRVDLPFYHRGCRRLENMFVYPQGGADFRPGTVFVHEVEDSAVKGRLIAWEEPGVANYFIECCVGKIKIYRENTRTLVHTISSGVPWSAAHLPVMVWAFDGNATMMFTHTAWKQLRLRHTAAGDTAWTLDQPTISIVNYTDTTLFNAAGHYAAVCAFVQGRLVLAAPDSAPNVAYLSKSWDPKTGTDRYLVFDLPAPSATTIYDDDAFCFPLTASKANRVYWISPGGDNVIFIGTAGGEYAVSGGNNGITANDHFIRLCSHFGGAQRQSVVSNDVTLFLQKGRKKIREIVYSEEAGKFITSDITLLSDHLGKERFSKLEISQVPYSLIYATRDDGELCVMSFERSAEIAAWQRLITDGEIEDIASLNGANEADTTWVLVKRTINGVTKRYIEAFKSLDHWDYLEDAFYVDCGKTYDNGPDLIITAVALTNPITITSVAHGLAAGTKIRLSGILGTTELNGQVFTVFNPTTDTFQLYDETNSYAVDGTSFLFEIDSDPTPAAFPNGATVTGATSGISGQIISRESGIKYFCTALSSRTPWTDGEIVSDGTNSRDCGTGYPRVTPWFTTYISGGKATVVQKAVSGLSHLAGKEVAILADGAVQPKCTISIAGEITLAEYANKIQVGLSYDSYLMPMPIEAGVQDGTAQGRKKRIERIVLRVQNSLGCWIGTKEEDLTWVPFRDLTLPLDAPPVPFTGDVEIAFPGGFDTTGDILIKHSSPLPLSIVAIMPRMSTYE